MSKNPKQIEVYRSHDPVIRRHVSPRDGGLYAARRDPEILYEAGMPRDAKPTLFVCRPLTRSQREGLELMSADKSRYRAAFRMSLVEIRDIYDEHGRPATPSIWKRPDHLGVGEALGDSELDALEALDFGDADIWDVGSAVEELSTVGKGVKPSCPLLDSSRRAWLTPSSSRPAEPKTDGETPPAG